MLLTLGKTRIYREKGVAINVKPSLIHTPRISTRRRERIIDLSMMKPPLSFIFTKYHLSELNRYLYILGYTWIYMEKEITIKVKKETKDLLDLIKIHPRQSYDEVLRRLIEEHKNE